MLTEGRHDGIFVEGRRIPNLSAQACAIGKTILHADQGRTDIRGGDGRRIARHLMASEAITFGGAEGEFLARHAFFFFGASDVEEKESNHDGGAETGRN